MTTAFVGVGQGQEAEDDPFAGVEEMVVVGTGAASLFQNREVSAIAFDAEYLEAIGASDLSDIAQFTPNLEIRTPFAASNPTLFIRGVGLRDFNANSSSSVAVYNDEVYMNSPAGQLSQLFDVQNIDVLRGPQGTIYGRNASAGTIRVIARKPTGTPGAQGSLTYGRFDQVDVDGAVENMIVPGVLSIRTAGKWSIRDGLTRNRCGDERFASVTPPPGPSKKRRVWNHCFSNENTSPIIPSPPGLGWVRGERAPVNEWVNDTDNWALRTILRFQETIGNVEMDWLLNFHGGQNRGDARQFQMVGATQLQNETEPRTDIPSDVDSYIDPDNYYGNVLPRIDDPFVGNPYEGDYNSVEQEEIDLFGTNLVGELAFGDYTLTTVTAYEWNKRDTVINLDANPYQSLEPRLKNRAYQVTQELRLDWDQGGGLSWQLGGMFLYESLTTNNQFTLSLFTNGSTQSYTFFTRYGSVWGNFAWEPAETFSLKGGLRLNHEDKELNLRSQQFTQLGGFQPVGDLGVANSATQETGLAGDIIATYSPLADVSFYLRYARGWKGPHINGGVINPGPVGSETGDLVSPVDPETVDSIEMGMKTQLWADRIKFNWALFYYDYQDIQVFQLKNVGGQVPVQELINADDADIMGFEAEFDIKPFEALAPPIFEGIWIHTTFAWLESKYTDFVNSQSVLAGTAGNTVTVTEDFSGNNLINSPEFSFIGFVAWPVGGDWGSLTPRFDWSFKDRVYFSPANSDLVSQDALWLMNFRLTYKSPTENFEISGWVENMTDQAYTVDVFNLARLRRSIVHAIGDPRTYGMTIKVSF